MNAVFTALAVVSCLGRVSSLELFSTEKKGTFKEHAVECDSRNGILASFDSHDGYSAAKLVCETVCHASGPQEDCGCLVGMMAETMLRGAVQPGYAYEWAQGEPLVAAEGEEKDCVMLSKKHDFKLRAVSCAAVDHAICRVQKDSDVSSLVDTCEPQNQCNPGYYDTTVENGGDLKWWACGVDCPGGQYLTDVGCNCACQPCQCYPQNTCNDGYMDSTDGNANWWACGVDCPGGTYYTDGICNCACIPDATCDKAVKCQKQGPCNDGYMDTTGGNYKWWACGADCEGGTYYTDGVCNCACEKMPDYCISEELDFIAAAGNTAVLAMESRAGSVAIEAAPWLLLGVAVAVAASKLCLGSKNEYQTLIDH